ncbi:putative NAD dependent epimerase/dehydratase [Nemania sp. FL0031]|nr:putative NAD dependent epimerase/dehydratase [Nemania sp. FL0031]
MPSTIFVVAATGTLGKALALELRKIDWNVHATVRDPTSPAARELASAGVKLFTGDWDNEEALRDAIAGCDGLFLNLMPSFTDMDADVRQGKSIVSIAKAAGVKHVVHSTGLTDMTKGRFEPTGLVAKFLNNKKAVEDAVRAAGFEAYTLLRPASFMANWLAPKVFMYQGLVETGIFTTAWRPDTVIPSVDEQDVAAFSVAAFKDPARFHRQEVEIASETHTTDEILKSLSQASGRQIRGNYLSDEEILAKHKDDIFLKSQMASRTMIEFYDMDKIKKWGIPLHTFQEYLEREKASVEQTYNRLR